MKVKILFFDDIFSTLFRNEHKETDLVWDDTWVSSLEKALAGANDRLDVNFSLVKSGEIESWKRIVEEEKPDVIIMDHYWPEHAWKKYGDRERGGEISMDTLRNIRQTFPDLPVISYTIKPNRELLEAAYANGVTFFLEKVAMAVPEVHNALKYIIIYLLRNKS
ncbi:hypothetical protein DSCO28_65620 [Desulfosarcina ovata subsp. sediminis]|uniref:Response regulatory domain-containing protein n=1 Tax=Desulfosarcina ovata subsp. sediminis TaxID=885957 RepID=A0A5K8A0Q1_9BACT|nr:response regulator [Desulfosarcina ovata]BBO85996.1 hypothetical protein DSCO28_65620 [Desulfosarcina ovata subsp. sediminis]